MRSAGVTLLLTVVYAAGCILALSRLYLGSISAISAEVVYAAGLGGDSCCN